MQRDGIYSLMERLLAADMRWGMGAVMFEQVHSDEHLWDATLRTADGASHKQPFPQFENYADTAIQTELEPKVWGPDATSRLALDDDPAGDPRCLRFSWNGDIERVPGFSGFSFWVNYWWKDELDPDNFGNWMGFRNELAGGSRYAPWTGSDDADEAYESDPASNTTFAAFDAWWSETHSVFQWRRLVNIMNAAPAMPAMAALELFLDAEFPDELIADYGRAGVESSEAAREFHRDGVALEFIAALNGR